MILPVTRLFTNSIYLFHILLRKVLLGGVDGTVDVPNDDLQGYQLVVEVCTMIAAKLAWFSGARTRYKQM
jgi:hypothetical protein